MKVLIQKSAVSAFRGHVVNLLKQGSSYYLIEKPTIGNREGDGTYGGCSPSFDKNVTWTSPDYSYERHKAGYYWWIPVEKAMIFPENNESACFLLKDD